MKKIYLIKTLLVFFTCFFFVMAKASVNQALSLTPATDPRIDIPQGEQHVIQYKLSNNSKKARSFSMKPMAGVTQEAGRDGECPLYATLNPGDSCLLTLKVDSQATIEKGSPLLCAPGSNWFDKEITQSSACIQPKKNEDMRVKAIPADMPSLSIILNQPNDNKLMPSRACFNSLMACSLVMFTGGAQATFTITNTSAVTAQNIQVITPGSVTVVSNNCPINLPAGASCTITVNPGSTRVNSSITIVGSNIRQFAIPTQVLGIGDPYNGGIIWKVNAGTNTGKIVATSDAATAYQWSPTTGLVGTTRTDGLTNTININALYGSASAAGLCYNTPSQTSQRWYLGAFDELEELVNVVLENPNVTWNVNTSNWYWDSTEAITDTTGDPASDPTTQATQARFAIVGGTIASQGASKISLASVRCVQQF